MSHLLTRGEGAGGGRKIWKRARTCEKILSTPGYSTDVSPDIHIEYILFSWKTRERFLLQKPVFFEVFLKLNFGSQIVETSTNIIIMMKGKQRRIQ